VVDFGIYLLYLALATWSSYRFSVQFLKKIQIPSQISFIRKYGDKPFLFIFLTIGSDSVS